MSCFLEVIHKLFLDIVTGVFVDSMPSLSQSCSIVLFKWILVTVVSCLLAERTLKNDVIQAPIDKAFQHIGPSSDSLKHITERLLINKKH